MTRGMSFEPPIWARRQLLAHGCASDDFEQYFSRCLRTVLADDRKLCNEANLIYNLYVVGQHGVLCEAKCHYSNFFGFFQKNN